MSLPERIDAFLFDMDGTLVDTEPIHWATALEVLGAHGVDVSEPGLEPAPGWGEFDFWDDMRRRFGFVEDASILAAERTAAVIAHVTAAPPPDRPGARAILKATDGVPRLIVSATPRDQVAAILASSGLAEAFPSGFVSGHEDVTRSKPAPDVYLLGAERLGVEPSYCVAVEDSVTGMIAAQAAGLYTVVVPSEPDAGFERADLLLDSLEDLLPLLQL